MKRPNGLELLAKLIDLYADQEGVKIEYILSERKCEHETEQ